MSVFDESKLLAKGKRALTYHAKNGDVSHEVILKVQKKALPSVHDTVSFYREYEFLKEFDHPNIRKARGKKTLEGRHVIELEFIDGSTLRDYLKGRKIPFDEFYTIVLQLAHAMAHIHSKNIIHNNLCPENILVQKSNREIKVIDFSLSSKLTLKRPFISSPQNLLGALQYMSPEQTGRMNRVVDYRSDLYSFGVICFELLAGQCPFESNKPLELVHSHIAKAPPRVNEINQDVPEELADLVGKLLGKSAEDRYQSAYGIISDLEYLQANHDNLDGSFQLAQDDYSGKFQISQKLYGREKEVDRLMHAFDEVSRGTTGHLFVGGYSGSGKSALIHEIHQAIGARNGMFISGKFDQFQRNRPYFSWINALDEFVNQILAKRKKKLSKWKSKILEAVGENGQILIDLVPNLELVIGPQPEVNALTGEEAQNRFNYVFQAFIKSLASVNHPLVIFFDDLQWADLASLHLLKIVLTNKSIRSLLFIGAYRDNEVNTGHPFQVILNEIEEELNHLSTLKIGNLTEPHVKSLVADTLQDENRYQELASLVYQKTQGNAFYVNSFLNTLYQDGHLWFDYQKKTWEWNKLEVQSKAISENVSEFMANKVNKLPANLQDALKLAACIGNIFDANLLSVISKMDMYELQSVLDESMQEGLILPLPKEHYRFVHDQVQQAVYTLILPKERAMAHVDIGRLIYASVPPNELNSYLSIHVFDVVDQLNYGQDIIKDDDERFEISKLNLLAGEKAHSSAAYEAAYDYLNKGINWIDDKSWKTDYAFTLSLYTEIVQTAGLCNRIDELEQYADTVFSHAESVLDKIPVYEVLIHSYTALNKYHDVIEIGSFVLRELGEKLPEKPSKLDLIKGLVKIKYLVGWKPVMKFADHPIMTDPIKKAANSILVSMGTSAMFGKPELLPIIAFRVVQLAVKYGNTPEITRGYAGLAMILCGGVGDIKTGSQYGKLALACCSTIDNSVYHSSTIQIYNTCIRHYTEHIKNSIKPLKDGYLKGLETGDLEAADFSIANYMFHRYFSGENLEHVLEEFEEVNEIVKEHQRTQVHNLVTIYYQTAANLVVDSKEPWMLAGNYYHEKEKLANHIKEKDATALFLLFYHKMTLAYLFYAYEEAMEYANQARKNIEGGISLMASVLFWGYDSLIRIARSTSLTNSESASILKPIKQNQTKLKKFARYCPENYGHLFDLVEAERARIAEKNVRARTYYDRAIDHARKSNFNNIEALASELAAQFHNKIGLEERAESYADNAYTKYYQWGAKAKLNVFRDQFKGSLLFKDNLRQPEFGDGIAGRSSSSALDINSVLEASQTIAQEISLDRLLNGMMKVVLENAGAERGLLILKGENRWNVEYEGTIGDIENPTNLKSIPVEEVGGLSDHPLLSLSIFDFVVRTKESLVLENASMNGNFTNTVYVRTKQPKSILCAPIVKQGQMTGCFYLENNLTAGAFTPERVELLDMLSSQMAISIENARLYENLEEKVRTRTKQLVLEKEKTEEAYENIQKLSFIGQQINSSLSLTKVIDTVYENINQILDASTFGVGIYNESKHEIVFKNVIQNGDKIPDFIRKINGENNCTNICFMQRHEIFIEDFKNERPSSFKIDIGEGARSIIFLPLTVKDKTKGLITVQSPKPGAYSKQHVNILRNLAVYAATAIAHANEYERSEHLLLNILPQETALELKEKGTASSKSYNLASILFTDFKGFTNIAEKMRPEEVVENLDYCFRAFDRIAKKHRLEKIKTIGDSYMCAGGIPTANKTNPVDAVNAAMEMMQFMNQWKQDKMKKGEPTWEVRLGIHSGKIVAGVVGENKFAYDIWGDAVNTASRMESSGEAGKINISGTTFELIKDHFRCTYRGKVKAKNKGEVDMYFVEEKLNR